MKKIAALLIITIVAAAIPAMAAEDGEALFKAKCAACHGADGAKNAKANLTSADVQKKTDDELVTFIGTNPKHNFTKKGLTDDQIKALVAHIRTFKK